MTYTYSELAVSRSAFDEIAGKLRDAGYGDAIHGPEGDQAIDMQGIGLVVDEDDAIQGEGYFADNYKIIDDPILALVDDAEKPSRTTTCSVPAGTKFDDPNPSRFVPLHLNSNWAKSL